ncbi:MULTISPECIES: DUF1302 domain-containing protein [unclassified Herbaspirillum]|uniref:DUF1302 domain-containing protein n=1 Tax=unclassified Herbaspirillum TaxID=2624150 RepID=UPI00116A682C|nr:MULTISPECIES: DUF1302 family protein [unclassified Herbaspirillum]MBB5390454.1 hypothetical protein [Herbaspirillum sp. SJZ102]TQK09051.1 uncharacterized protein DUF1302 [Herbaspirillum sp. SJZ130]TQK14262.1 uncharacterized protein DUF1302 [Herbaspirillum sp. SJZ106]
MQQHARKIASENKRTSFKAFAAMAGTLVASASAHALDLNPGGDWQTRWDNTVKYSAGYRIGSPRAELTNGTGKANNDDGDRNFNRGLISNRIDLLSEFDIQKDGMGLRLSGAAWYDTVYNSGTANTSPGTSNNVNSPYNQFSGETRRIAGNNAEMLDWFVFNRHQLGDATLSYRLGQHSLIWGTTLFFGMNGIAKGMAPIDLYKLSIPGAQAKETTIPVPQLSGTLQLTDDTSVEAYYQFKYRPTRLHPAGSYLSSTDMLGDGAESIYAGPLKLKYAGMVKGSLPNNFGVALNTRSEWLDADLGFYAIRYNDTSTQVVTQASTGRYYLAVPNNVKSIGASISRLVGIANVGLEASMRFGQPLVAKSGTVVIPAGASAGWLASNVPYPTGRTAHLNLSTTIVTGASSMWDGASVVGELSANHLNSADRNADKVDTSLNKNSYGGRVVFTPTWYQVAPGLDVSLPLNLGWSFKGKSVIDTAFPFSGSPDHGGEFIVGLTGVYLNKWTANLSLITYLGNASTQPLLDRDYMRLSLQASF